MHTPRPSETPRVQNVRMRMRKTQQQHASNPFSPLATRVHSGRIGRQQTDPGYVRMGLCRHPEALSASSKDCPTPKRQCLDIRDLKASHIAPWCCETRTHDTDTTRTCLAGLNDALKSLFEAYKVRPSHLTDRLP